MGRINRFLRVVPHVLLIIVCDAASVEKPLLLKAEAVQTPDIFLSQALFGSIPSMDSIKEPWCTIQSPPSNNPLLCEDVTDQQQLERNKILLIPRGTCSFQQKSLNAQRWGALGVLIYQTLASHYSLNATSTKNQQDHTIQDIVFPLDKHDYDCKNGEMKIPVDQIVLNDPWPYNAGVNDPVLTSTLPSSTCDSNRYFLTGPPSEASNAYRACCAWDLSMEMGIDYSLNRTEDIVKIPAAFVTLRQHEQLQFLLSKSPTAPFQLLQRWHPTWNISAVLIWALGVIVAAWAAWSSAAEYRKKRRRLLRRRERPTTPATPPRPAPLPPPEEVMDITAAHVGMFIVSASSSLLILFYFKIYGVVKVFYAIGCSTALAQVVLYPIISRFVLPHNRVVLWRDVPDVGDITLRDAVAHGTAFALGAIWLYLAFMIRDPDQIAFFWILQDVFGACMCNVFLQVIRLNNLKVATLLLTVAFFYDIFFVFITPHLFLGKSVMITVATSGGPPTLGPEWCEKYPDDAGCQGGNPLPMLLTIPRLMDYRGGASMLGLGDIVLPGLLLSFGARLDVAKDLIGLRQRNDDTRREDRSGQSFHDPCPPESRCGNGYFGPLVIAYAVGLAMANAAVYLMRMGQPALLYLVPCCLGTICIIGWRKQETRHLWDGPVWLDENSSVEQHDPIPQEEESAVEAIEVPSAVQSE